MRRGFPSTPAPHLSFPTLRRVLQGVRQGVPRHLARRLRGRQGARHLGARPTGRRCAGAPAGGAVVAQLPPPPHCPGLRLLHTRRAGGRGARRCRQAWLAFQGFACTAQEGQCLVVLVQHELGAGFRGWLPGTVSGWKSRRNRLSWVQVGTGCCRRAAARGRARWRRLCRRLRGETCLHLHHPLLPAAQVCCVACGVGNSPDAHITVMLNCTRCLGACALCRTRWMAWRAWRAMSGAG